MPLNIDIKGTWDDNTRLPIKCPKCGHTTDELLSKLQQNKACVCGGCEETITITGSGLADLEALKKALTGLGK